MASLVPYLDFGGRAAEAAAFYERVFGGQAELQRDGDRVLQLEFRAGDLHFMGADHEPDAVGVASSRGYSLVLNCDTEAQLRDFHEHLVDGGTEVFAPVDGGWGAIVAHCIDRFGVSWLLNFDQPAG